MIYNALFMFHLGLSVLMTIAGIAALLFSKGGQSHRWAGNSYFCLALTLVTTGAVLVVLRPSEFAQGWIAMCVFYLVFTGWATAIERTVGPYTKAGAVLGTVLVLVGVVLALNRLEEGDTFIGRLFLPGLICWFTCMDVLTIQRGGEPGPKRTIRHSWRMGLSLLIVAGASTLAQPQLYPELLRPILFMPMAFVAVATLYFLAKTVKKELTYAVHN